VPEMHIDRHISVAASSHLLSAFVAAVVADSSAWI
jgi:hypothetical protein